MTTDGTQLGGAPSLFDTVMENTIQNPGIALMLFSRHHRSYLHARDVPASLYRTSPLTCKLRKLDGMKQAIARNQTFLDAVVEFQDRSSPFPLGADEFVTAGPSKTTARQMDKVSTTLHQMMRDWSVEGAEERKQSYGLVIGELQRLLPVGNDETGDIKVLVPGAGLGRLTMELVSRGYSTQGRHLLVKSLHIVCL